METNRPLLSMKLYNISTKRSSFAYMIMSFLKICVEYIFQDYYTKIFLVEDGRYLKEGK